MQPFQNLRVWQDAHALTLDVYRASRLFPADERFGLTNQLRRAASSVGANLAEGSSRRTDADFARFVQIAVGSVSEVENHLLLARDLGYLDSESVAVLVGRLSAVR
ncbi:MAG: four helix bundle protein, partial [Bacteroidota bacterium]